ncbi:MAG: FprA family A-type flavoprotein [Clostridium sp.]|uniref:FprA family A-type flavoprotein n=1 Tax=Clostridium sp. TaxID=1506 RepID=UPI002FCBEF82
MGSIKIKDDLYFVGVKDKDLLVFDIIMKLENGTTYNSYLIIDDKITLIDGVKQEFTEEYINNIRGIIGDKEIDYLIVNHTEPDHTGAIERIIKEYENITIVASTVGCGYLKKIIHRDFNTMAVRDGDELCIGKRTLKFLTTPLLHWPDTMFTYCEELSALFTCDAFGCHYCPENTMFNASGIEFSHEFKLYYQIIMSPFKKNILTAIDKISLLNYDIILTSHGPILNSGAKLFVKLYEEWSSNNDFKGSKYIPVLYASAYGYTKDIANEIARGAESEGYEVEVIDLSKHPVDDLMPRIERAAAIAVGSPTINQDAVRCIWDCLARVQPTAIHGTPALAFGSYGWSGEAIDFINERLTQLNFKPINTGYKVKFKPTEDEIKKAFEYGQKLANIHKNNI